MTCIIPYLDFESIRDFRPYRANEKTNFFIETLSNTVLNSPGVKIRYPLCGEHGEQQAIATFDVPGMSKENVVVTYDDENHTLSVKTSERLGEKEKSIEQHNLTLSVKPLLISSIKAKCEHGRVTITGTLATEENKKTRHLISVE